MIVPLLSAGHGISPRGFWYSWVEEPLLILCVFAAVAAYITGLGRLRREIPGLDFPTWRVVCYFGGVVAFVAALLSPIAAYSEQLFSMHMVQHLLLLLAAPPLILLGTPLLPLLWALPKVWRKNLMRRFRPNTRLGRVLYYLAHPIVAVVAYVACVGVWHIPNFYDAAQGRTFMHDLEHVMFYGSALLFWWPIVAPPRRRRRLSLGLALPYLLPPFLEGMLIGVLLTFSNRPLYTTYEDLDTQPIWGLGLLDDQQLGGLIMWVPGGMFFLIPLMGILVQFLREDERRSPSHSRAGS